MRTWQNLEFINSFNGQCPCSAPRSNCGLASRGWAVAEGALANLCVGMESCAHTKDVLFQKRRSIFPWSNKTTIRLMTKQSTQTGKTDLENFIARAKVLVHWETSSTKSAWKGDCLLCRVIPETKQEISNISLEFRPDFRSGFVCLWLIQDYSISCL